MRGINKGRPGRPGDAVIVTGSGTGIGLETALHLAAARLSRVRDGPQPGPAATELLAAAAERGVSLEVLAARPHRPRQHRRRDRHRAGGRRGHLRARQQRRRRPARMHRGLRGGGDPAAVRDQRARHDRGHEGGDPAHARGGLRADRHGVLGRRARVRLRRHHVLRDQVRAGGARRGPGAGARAVRHPVGDRRAGDHQDHPLVAPPRHRRARERPRAARTTTLFWASEAIADRIVERSPTRPEHVARAIAAGADGTAAADALRRRARRLGRDRAAPLPAAEPVRAPVLRRAHPPARAPARRRSRATPAAETAR